MDTAARRLLLVDLPGVRRDELDRDATPTLWSIVAQEEPAKLRRETVLTAADELLTTGVVDDLRSLGLSVDQRGMGGRPRWRTDDGVLGLLARRPCGPADVTMVRFSDPLRAAAERGPRSRTFGDVLRSTEARLTRLIGELRLEGRTPRVWAIAWGELQDVLRTVDPLASLRRVLPRSERALCEGSQDHGTLRVRCANQPTMVRVKHWLLRQEEVAAVHDIYTPPPGTALEHGEILALAADGIAFGPQAVRARLCRMPAAKDGVLALDDGMCGARTLRDLAAHMLFVGAEMAQATWPAPAAVPAAREPIGVGAEVEGARSPLEILEAQEVESDSFATERQE